MFAITAVETNARFEWGIHPSRRAALFSVARLTTPSVTALCELCTFRLALYSVDMQGEGLVCPNCAPASGIAVLFENCQKLLHYCSVTFLCLPHFGQLVQIAEYRAAKSHGQ